METNNTIDASFARTFDETRSPSMSADPWDFIEGADLEGCAILGMAELDRLQRHVLSRGEYPLYSVEMVRRRLIDFLSWR